jgi:EAL domain-containing protein (putative c-di-GMP-specific phosphodiesterase class I)/DNA-binding response OmpR family regulator
MTAAKKKKQAVILVLDDEESVGTFVRAALPEDRFRIVWCSDVEKSIVAVRREKADIAMVDTELAGGQPGWEFLRHIRSDERTKSMPVVMLTESADTLDREKSHRMGADRYLIKPVQSDTLRRVVRELLGARDDLWWTMTLGGDEVKRLRELFYDPMTDVPTLGIIVDEIRAAVESDRTLEVYCLEIEPLFRVGERERWDAFDGLRKQFVRGLRVMAPSIIGNDAIIATSHSGASDFYCFVEARDGSNLSENVKNLERIARRALTSSEVDPTISDEVMVFVGAAMTQKHPVFAPRILYNAVREAKDSAERRESRYFHVMREHLVRAIQERAIRTVFQPVVDLSTGLVLGYEALSRGPIGSAVEKPEVMFELARDFDLVWELETLCIQNVKPWLDEICERGCLFFNLESHFISQLQQRGTGVFETFFNCKNIVIEVTERSAIRDYQTFRNALHQLKSMGFKIAIDDCGSGYASLEAIAELRPDYLKVGHSLFKGVEKDPIRRRLVDLVARSADSIGAATIAEAIETEEQLAVTRDLGIGQGQGYLFAAPAPWEQIREWGPAEPAMAPDLNRRVST